MSFSSEIWGHFAFTFCRYCPQIWKMKNLFINQGHFQIKWQCSRNCPPKVFCPQIWKTENNLSLQKSREIAVYFSDKVFSLSMPSVCPHLTTVYWTHLTSHNIKINEENVLVNTCWKYYLCLYPNDWIHWQSLRLPTTAPQCARRELNKKS